METSQSPRMVLRAAHRLALKVLPAYSCKLSRQDFTLAQLFACLVLREFYGLSYRRTERLLIDSPQWLADIGLSAAPDHNTLWRAFGVILKTRCVNRLLDLLVALFARAKLLRLGEKPVALDSTCFEQHHRSAHYDRRCRRMLGNAAAAAAAAAANALENPRKPRGKPGKWGASVNASRSRRLSAMPKLSVAVASGCHLILAAKVRTGNGSDAPDFDDLLFRSWRRANVKVVVADAGYDSEANHRTARQDMGVRRRSFRRASAARRTSCRPADGGVTWQSDLHARRIKRSTRSARRAKPFTAWSSETRDRHCVRARRSGARRRCCSACSRTTSRCSAPRRKSGIETEPECHLFFTLYITRLSESFTGVELLYAPTFAAPPRPDFSFLSPARGLPDFMSLQLVHFPSTELY